MEKIVDIFDDKDLDTQIEIILVKGLARKRRHDKIMLAIICTLLLLFYLIDCVFASSLTLNFTDTNPGIHGDGTAPANAECGFTIERKDPGQNNFHVIAIIDGSRNSTVSYIDYTVIKGQQYTYRVNAFHNGGASAYSNEATATVTNDIVNPNVDNGMPAKRTALCVDPTN